MWYGNIIWTWAYFNNLYISVPPRADVDPSVAQFATGQSVNLTCHSKGFPKPAIYWLRDGKLLIPNNRMVVDNNRLSIRQMVRGDEGEYACLAKNTAGEFTTLAQLEYIGMQSVKMNVLFTCAVNVVIFVRGKSLQLCHQDVRHDCNVCDLD